MTLPQDNDEPTIERAGALAAAHDRPAPARRWLGSAAIVSAALLGVALLYQCTGGDPDKPARKPELAAEPSRPAKPPPHPSELERTEPAKTEPAATDTQQRPPLGATASATQSSNGASAPARPRRVLVDPRDVRAAPPPAATTASGVTPPQPAALVAAWVNRDPQTSTAPTLAPCIMLGATDTSAAQRVTATKQCTLALPIRNAAGTADLIDAGATVTLRVLPVQPGQRIANAVATSLAVGGLYGWTLPDVPMMDAQARAGVEAQVSSHTAERIGLAIAQALGGASVTGVLGASGGMAVVTPAMQAGVRQGVQTLPEQFNTAPAAHLEPNRVVLVALPMLDASAVFRVEPAR